MSLRPLAIAAMITAVIALGAGAGQRRPPPKPAVPTAPRTPAVRGPAPAPRTAPPSRQYVYPFPPVNSIDFVYEFPYGPYPYRRFGYPDPEWYVPLPPASIDAVEEGEWAGIAVAIPQADAAVFIDGVYVGLVDGLNDPAEAARVRPGPHHVEIYAPGFESAMFDVNVTIGRTLTYRVPLRRVSP